MVEIPDHLLRRAAEARRRASGEEPVAASTEEKIYRLAWDRRTKPCCSTCCKDENHDWTEAHSDPGDLATIENAERKFPDDDSRTETRNVRIQEAPSILWADYEPWSKR